MGAQTEVLKLYMPGGGSLGLGGADEVLDVDKLNQNSQKIDAFAKGWGVPAERNQQFYGLAAGRSLLTGMKHGDTYQDADGSKRLWRFDGTNWVAGDEGRKLGSVQMPLGNVSGIGTTETEITGLSLSITLPVERSVEIAGIVNVQAVSSTTEIASIALRDDTTVLRYYNQRATATSVQTTRAVSFVDEVTLGAGTHRLNLAAKNIFGTPITIVSEEKFRNFFRVRL